MQSGFDYHVIHVALVCLDHPTAPTHLLGMQEFHENANRQSEAKEKGTLHGQLQAGPSQGMLLGQPPSHHGLLS